MKDGIQYAKTELRENIVFYPHDMPRQRNADKRRRTGANKELAEESGSRTHQGPAGGPFSDLKSGRPTGDASLPSSRRNMSQ
jgi:hypothetical protein